MRCGGKEEKSVRKSPGMVIYDTTPLLSQSARALWDRSGVAAYITIPGDFRTPFSSFPPHLIHTRLHTITHDLMHPSLAPLTHDLMAPLTPSPLWLRQPRAGGNS